MIYIDNFRLRLIDQSDLDFVRLFRESNEIENYLGSFFMSNTKRQEEWFNNLNHDITKEYYIYEKCQKDNIEILGIVRTTDIDFINRSMCVGGDILPYCRGKGYGSKLYDLIFKLGFDKLNLNRLWLLVLEDNKRAISLYESKGFKKEGVLKKAIYKNGIYLDYILMGFLREEYYEYKKNSAI